MELENDGPSIWMGNKKTQIDKKGVNMTPNSPFYLTHHPNSWELVIEDGKPEFLPKFGTLKEIPGVQGVRFTKNGADSSMARLEAQDNGKVIIPWDYEYLTRYPSKQGGHYYCVVFATPKQLAGQTILKLDEVAYNNFRRSLLADGLIAPMDPDLVDIFIDRQKNRLSRYIRDQHIPEIAKKMRAIEEKISNMKKALLPEEPPKPKRGRRKNANV